MTRPTIMPVIMSGGAGSRLWPLSRQAVPKQLLPLVTDKTMVQETVLRFTNSGMTAATFDDPVFICNARHADAIQEQMNALGQTCGGIIVEPMGRNTAPCAVVAAAHALSLGDDTLVLLVPADHHVRDPKAFRAAIDKAVPAARNGQLVTFGIAPDRPETGYGYIQRGEDTNSGVFSVRAFKEKPDAATAKDYIAAGDYAWNAGIFLFSPKAFLSEVEKFEPTIRRHAERAYKDGVWENGCLALDAEAFAECPGQSIDYAVMETTDKATVVPCDIGWSDIGSFASLHEVRGGENILSGDVLTDNVSNCLIQTDGPLVSAVGVEGLSIIVHEGQILVAALDAAQDVKKIVETLKKKGRVDRL
mgnify:CR=1 FL=1